jgi:hypothetical protein
MPTTIVYFKAMQIFSNHDWAYDGYMSADERKYRLRHITSYDIANGRID